MNKQNFSPLILTILLLTFTSLPHTNLISASSTGGHTQNRVLTGHTRYQNFFPLSQDVNLNSVDSILFECSDPNADQYYREAIPSIDDPKFISVGKADSQIDGNDLIFGLEVDGEVRGYPHNILRFHEIVNDHTSNTNLGVTYCPLTGSPVIYDAAQIGNSEIGVTGLLFESNLVFFDRDTDTCFSQMLNFGMSGHLRGQQLDVLPIIETTWDTWKKLYPESKILSRDIKDQSSERYDRNPYENYETDASILYPVNNLDQPPYNLYDRKEKTLALGSGNDVFLFPYEELEKAPVTNHQFLDDSISVIYDEENRIAVPFYSNITDYELSFELVTNRSQYSIESTFGLHIFRDTQTNSVWNIKGEAIDGTLKGEQLIQFPSFQAYWFSASIFYPSALIFSENNSLQYSIEPEFNKLSVPGEDTTFDVILLITLSSLFILMILVLYKTREN
ncbi:MAG: DUF3179 domain-containing protein [Candidatus Heimdallarchaeota archaeon]|nr:DUF3179 domain-containing protein [Candidatus Heimdallarchaeota archaeon]